MNRQAIPLGRLLGISIGLDYSWFLIFALLTWTLAASYYPAEFSNWSTGQYWIIGAVTAVLFFGCVLLHELGHSMVARRYAIPVRSITLFVFGGVAQIGAEPPSATSEFWIAIAGPIVSFALAVVFRLLQFSVVSVEPLLALAKYLAYINVTLAVFNLIPGFPLDGGRIFRAIVWGTTRSLRRATLIAANVGRLIAFIFIVVGVAQIFRGNFGGGIWIAFIGWFLESAAAGQVQQQMIQSLLAGHKVSEAMGTNYVVIPGDATLQQLVDQHVLASGRRSFVVKDGERVVGLVTLHDIKEVPREEWPATTAARAMIPLERMRWVRAETELWAATEKMDRDGVNQLPVMADGRILGMLAREDIISYLRTLQELRAA